MATKEEYFKLLEQVLSENRPKITLVESGQALEIRDRDITTLIRQQSRISRSTIRIR